MSAGLFLLAVSAGAAIAGGDDPGFARSVLRVADDGTRLLLRDLDGDGDLDLVFVEEHGLGLRYLRPDGTYPATHDAHFPWPSENLAWCLADADDDGATEIACVVNGSEVRLFDAPSADGPEAASGDGALLLETHAFLPRGRHRLSFLRDVDGDGSLDLVIPSSGSFTIHLRERGGGWSAPLEVRLSMDLDHEAGDPERLDSSFGQEVRIPWFRLEDLSGDGRPDLVAETEDAVFFHLATPELASAPTWTLDLAALRGELPEEDGIDFDNLIAEAGRQVDWKMADLDGDGVKDLIVVVGSKLRVYRRGALTGPDDTPDQVLKSSGLVMCTFLRDVDGDSLPDLLLCRGEGISLARMLRWLVLPGSYDLEVFTYSNDGGAFSRKPTRRNTLSIEFPRILALVDRIEALEEELEAQADVPARRADLDGDGVADDVVDVRDGELLLHAGRAPLEDDPLADLGDGDFDELFETFLARELGDLEDGGSATFDLGEVDRWAHAAGAGLREACAGLDPDRRTPVEPGLEGASIHVQDLDRDGHPDFVVHGRAEGEHVLQVLIDLSP